MRKKQTQDIVDVKKEYSVSQMVLWLKQNWEIDFHKTEWRVLKIRAVAERSYLLDLACDVKELLTEQGTDKYFYIDVLLGEFKKELEMKN